VAVGFSRSAELRRQSEITICELLVMVSVLFGINGIDRGN
jgi:hypothetical protein